jgi:hypothetical protein
VRDDQAGHIELERVCFVPERKLPPAALFDGGCGFFFFGAHMRRDDTLRVWTTLSEQSYDRRTEAAVFICQHVSDRWMWRVLSAGETKTGYSSSRKSARAAARRYVRSLDAKPDRQLHLFTK